MTGRLTTFKIGDSAVKPADVPYRDLREALDHLEKAILGEARKLTPDLREDQVHFAVVAITEGSDEVTIAVSDEVAGAATLVEESIKKSDFKRLGAEAHEHIWQIHKRLVPKYRQWGYSAGKWPAKSAPIASAEKPVPEPIRETTLRSQSTIFGRIMLAGGAKPKLHIEVDGATISVTTSAEVAKRVGARLYEVVGLEGIATWNAHDFKIVSFEATHLLDYREGDLRSGFAVLANQAGQRLQKLSLVQHFKEEREGDDS